MPTIADKIFLITHQNEQITFFPRFMQQKGRDILCVKIALGQVISPPAENRSPSDSTVGTQWFDCDSGKELTIDSGVTFDKKLKRYLMSYQLQNQFLILSYYFEKYSVEKLKTKEDLLKQVYACIAFFDNEFGNINEATLAVLHGWRPDSVFSNKSYSSDEDNPVDQVSGFLWQLCKDGTISFPDDALVEETIEKTPEQLNLWEQTKRDFSTRKQSYRNWALNIESEYPEVYIKYKKADEESLLFSASKNVAEAAIEMQQDEMTPQQKVDLASRAFEPNMAIDPDPFDINSKKIGYFLRTEYTFINLPLFSGDDDFREQTKTLTDSALSEVLKFYNKPVIWGSSFEDPKNVRLYFDNTDSMNLASSSPRVTTNTFIDEMQINEDQYDSLYQDYDSLMNEPLITFVEFRSPSLRPGDVYRAYFEINKEKFDIITTESFENNQQTDFFIPDSKKILQDFSDELNTVYCADDAPLTEEQARNQYARYRAFASKKKLEISRQIRAAYMKAIENGQDIDDVEVDLGVFGKINLSDEEIINTTLNATFLGLSEGVGALLNTDSLSEVKGLIQDDVSNELTLTFEELEIGCKEIAENLANAEPDLKNFDIRNQNGQKYNATGEGNKVKSIPSIIIIMARRNAGLRSSVRDNDGFDDVESYLRGPPGQLFKGPSQRTNIEFKFLINNQGDTEIEHIKVYNKEYSEIGTHYIFRQGTGGTQLLSSLTDSRSVEYLRNIYGMTSLADGVGSYIGQIFDLSGPGCGPAGSQLGLGMAYVKKFTKDIQIAQSFNSYVPLHHWKENVINQAPIKSLEKTTDEIGSYFQRQFSKEAIDTNLLEMTGLADAVPLIGPDCSRESIYHDVAQTFQLKKLICNYAACLKLPDFEFKTPNLNWPDIGEIPIFKINFGLDQLDDFLQQVLTRAICAFINGLLDILKTPFCQEQLAPALYGAGSDTSPIIQRALVDGILDIGIPIGKMENAKSLVDKLLNLLTPREICALLEGKTLNDEVIFLIYRIAEQENLSIEISSPESVIEFFTTLGQFIDEEVCEQLNKFDETLGTYTCTSVSDMLSEIRKSIIKGKEVSAEQINEAVKLANDNLMDKTKALQSLGNGGSLADLIPELYDLDSIVNQNSIPVTAMEKLAASSAFETARLNFLNSMNSFVDSMYLESPRVAEYNDPGYDPEATRIVQRATANLQRLSHFAGTSLESVFSTIREQSTTNYLRRTLLYCSDDYKTQTVQNFLGEDIQIYTPLQIEDENQAGATPDDQKAYLSGSLVRLNDILAQAPDNDENISDVVNKLENRRVLETVFPIVVGSFPNPEDLVGESTPPENITTYRDFLRDVFINPEPDAQAQTDNIEHLNRAYVAKIVSLIDIYKRQIESNIDKAYRIISEPDFLKILKDFYDTSKEVIRLQNNQEIIKVTTEGNTLVTKLSEPSDTYQTSITMIDKPTVGGLEYEITVDDEFFFGGNKKFVGCDTLPEQYSDLFDSSEDIVNPRAKSYRISILKNLQDLYSKYKLSGMPQYSQILQEYPSIENDLEKLSFSNTYEGSLEQLINLVGDSKLFSDSQFVNRMDAKLQSKSYYDPLSLCVKNPRGLPSFGILNFENIVFDIFEEESKKESLLPINSILLQDPLKPGAYEKAIQNTAVRGFVRICLLEMVMKGAVSYSAWDIEYIKNDNFFKEYVYRFIKNQLENQNLFSNNLPDLHRCLERITGKKNIEASLRQIVLEESDFVFKYSKTLYENNKNIDYRMWFLEQLEHVEVPSSKVLDTSLSKNVWISNLEKSVLQQSENNFVFLERYIRIFGALRGSGADASGIAQAQYQSFLQNLDSLNTAVDKTGFNRLGLESYNISDSSSVTISEYVDDDDFPDKELLSISDLTKVINSLFDNNSEINRYFHDLTRRIYNPGNILHSLPRAISRLPAKLIIRKRNRYVFSTNNAFSAHLRNDPDLAPFTQRRFESNIYQDQVEPQRSDGEIDPSVGGAAGLGAEKAQADERFSDEDRYYVIPIDGAQGLPEAESIKAGGQFFTNNPNEDVENFGFEPSAAFSGNEPGLIMKDVVLEGERKRPLDPTASWLNVSDTTSERPPEDVIFKRVPVPRNPNFTTIRKVFDNIYGQVNQEQFNNISNTNQIAEEIWEESVIDLVGDAAPIFNFPGDSKFIPNDHMSTSDKSNLGYYLETASRYYKSGTGRNRGACNFYNSEDRQKIFEQTSFDSGNVFTVQGEVDSEYGAPSPNAVISRPMGLEDHPGGANDLTFASNNVSLGAVPGSPDANWRVKGEHELLGRNDYKVPIRILITQIKEASTGRIMQVFVKYVIPELMDFADTSLNPDRARALKDAAVECLQAFKTFIENGFNDLKNDPGRNGQILRDDGHIANAEDTTPAADLGMRVKANESSKHFCVYLAMGNDRVKVPVLFRQKGAPNFGASSAPSFCSISKFYSIAALNEAKDQKGNFKIDQASIDNHFADPGKLLRNSDYDINSSYSVLDEGRAAFTQHSFYADSVRNIIKVSGVDFDSQSVDDNYDPKRTLVSIGNLVSWFSQKRNDAFWGRTHKTQPDSQAIFTRCGPSLFYGDGRGSIKQFFVAGKEAILNSMRDTPADANIALIDHIQNLYNQDEVDNKTLATRLTTAIADQKQALQFYRTLFETPAGERTEVNNSNFATLAQDPTFGNFDVTQFGYGSDPPRINYSMGHFLNGDDTNLIRVFQGGNSSVKSITYETLQNLNFYKIHNSANTEKYMNTAMNMRARYNAGLEETEILNFMEQILTSFFIQNEDGESVIKNIIQESSIKIGLRAVLATNGDNGNLESFVTKTFNETSQVSEEERTGLVKIGEDNAYENLHCIPIASFEADLLYPSCFNIDNLSGLTEVVDSFKPQLMQGLLDSDQYKQFFDFSIPQKRQASVISLHSTSLLAGYSTMPDVLSSVKDSLAGTFYLAFQTDTTSSSELSFDLSSADLLAVTDQFMTSDGLRIDCMNFPGLGDWMKLLSEIIKKFVKQFPSIVLRGIANEIDPAYKEMRRHYLACEIEDLRFKGLHYTGGEGKNPLGLRGGTVGEKKYIPLNVGLPYDITVGGYRAIFEGNPRLLAASISKLVGYIFGGPLALLDPSYAFRVPCKDVDISGEGIFNWEKFTIGNMGRYGHPLTPITLLALSTKQLPGDIDQKNAFCMDRETMFNPQLFCFETEE